MKSKNTAFAALAFDLAGAPATEIQLLPAGEFAARDGRPGPGLVWRLDAAAAARVIARFESRKNPAVIDYEHQTMFASYKDGAAPAAGWFTGLRFDADGLWATGVTWTARASAMIAASEYRFISAVFSYLPDSGEILEIHHAGLTNDPALDGLAEVFQHRAAAHFSYHSTETTVDLTQLITLLGLAADADEAAVLAALKTLQQTADQAEGLRQQVAALSAQTDPAKVVPIAVATELRNQIAALTARINTEEADRLLEAALADGRLLPAMATWARELAQTNLAALKSYLTSAQPIAALTATQTNGKPPATGGAHGLTEQQLAVCRNCGIDPADYAKTLVA